MLAMANVKRFCWSF